jgi:signal transduction histidine kinase
MEYTNLANVLRDVVQEQSRSATNRTITLQLPTDANVFVFADVDRIEQVLTNFISNALKYSTPDKPVQIWLQKRGQDAYVAVHDEGPGIAKQEQANVFERFYRVKGIEVRSGSGVGLGLGLYISKTIIDLHSGQIGVDSEEGKGSTFWFTLPLAE